MGSNGQPISGTEINSKGQKIFSLKNKYISFDINGHSKGFWKVWNKNETNKKPECWLIDLSDKVIRKNE